MTKTRYSHLEKETQNKIYCGVTMQFEQDRGNAVEITENTVFIVLPTTPTSSFGQEGILYIYYRGHIFEEPSVVVQTRATGIVVSSLRENSILSHARSQISEVVYIDYRHNETRAALLGCLDADLLDDFNKIAQHSPTHQFRYILDFEHVHDVAPSGLAMLLQLSIASSWRNDVQIINCSEKIIAILESVALPSTGIVIYDHTPTESEANNLCVTTEINDNGYECIKIFMPEIFDYEFRVNFPKAYKNRKKNAEYILDFTATKHFAKSAMGTLLLMYKHIGYYQTPDIKIINCSARIKRTMEIMELTKFFHFI